MQNEEGPSSQIRQPGRVFVCVCVLPEEKERKTKDLSIVTRISLLQNNQLLSLEILFYSHNRF